MTSLVSLETLLAAVFPWITPLRAALSIAVTTFFKAFFALSMFLFFTSVSTLFEKVFNKLLIDRFLNVLALSCRTLLRADLFFLTAGVVAKILPPDKL